MAPEPKACPECEGTEGRAVWLPGDGTSAMESVWVPCATCQPRGPRGPVVTAEPPQPEPSTFAKHMQAAVECVDNAHRWAEGQMSVNNMADMTQPNAPLLIGQVDMQHALAWAAIAQAHVAIAKMAAS